MQVRDYGGMILLCLLHRLICLYAPEVLYMVWYLFLRECWDCTQRVFGRVEATRSCCWRISFSVEYFRILIGLRRGGVPCGSYCVCWRIIVLSSRQRRNRTLRKRRLPALSSRSSWPNMGRCLLSMQNSKAVGLRTGNCRKRSLCIC